MNFNFKWVYGLKPHPPALSSQKNKMLIFGLRSTSGDWLGWSMDSNPIHHPTPAKKIKCSFLDYVPTSDDRPGWSIDSNLIRHPSMFIFGLCSTSDDQLSDSSKKHRPKCKKWKRSPKSLNNQMFIFGLRSTSDDWPNNLSKKCWPKHKKKQNKKGPLSHQKIKCSFFDYV